MKIPLQDQPFRVLTMLLWRAGELVTREEFQQALWPAGTYVEFDEGLNKAIQKLRQALDDSPDNPIFIETLHPDGRWILYDQLDLSVVNLKLVENFQ
jgi:DNA-binding winged helix-turn-helix (wHTH) protein